MGKRERYEPGTFCWVDLATTDSEGAKAFYSGLFGWETEDTPAGQSGTYTMLRLEGDDVGGLYEMGPEQREQGARPYWLSYVSFESADATAERARNLGPCQQDRRPRRPTGRSVRGLRGRDRRVEARSNILALDV